MACVEERYHNGYYADKSYPDNPVDPVMVDFLNGNPNPMIAEINQEQYNGFYIRLSTDGNTPPETFNTYIHSLATLIDQTPSLTHFGISDDINSHQAAELASHVKDSNICYLTLRSHQWTSDGMTSFTRSLSDSKVQQLSIAGHLSDEAIAAMSFKEAPFESVLFDQPNASEAGLVQLFQHFYGSPVTHFALWGQNSFSAETAKQIDFSQTNFTTLEFFGVNFEQGALDNLSFAGSHIHELSIDKSLISGDDLKGLSQNLQDSEITKLSLQLDDMASGDLAQLQLIGTPVENLSLFYQRGVMTDEGFNGDLANLHLEGTQVTTLILGGTITDQDLSLFNLKNTSVVHLNLGHQKFTENSISLLKDIIKGTCVQDVSYNQDMLFNEDVLPNQNMVTNAETSLPALQLSDVLIVENHFMGEAPTSSTSVLVSSLASPNTDPATVPPIAHNDPLSYMIDTLAGCM